MEVAHLLNPAFCGEVLARWACSHLEEAEVGPEQPLSYIVLPVVLHSTTRQRLSGARQLHVWLQQNPDLRVGFADRVRGMKEITDEALLFEGRYGRMSVDSEGRLEAKFPKSLSSDDETQVADCFRRATTFGRLTARAGSLTSIFTMWGIRP